MKISWVIERVSLARQARALYPELHAWLHIVYTAAALAHALTVL